MFKFGQEHDFVLASIIYMYMKTTVEAFTPFLEFRIKTKPYIV